jgi:hypothetical protein
MRRRALLSAAVASGLVALALLAWGGWRFKRYVDTDPRLCLQCHKASPEFAVWNRGRHRNVSCQSCHHSTTREGLAMLRAFLSGREPGGKGGRHAEVKLGSCAACHLSHDSRWPQIEGSRGHRVHVEQKKIECVTCHAQAMHGFTPAVDICRTCHGDKVVEVVGMQQLHCFACHNFLSSDPGLLPTRADCLRCHRESGVHPGRFSESAPMRFDCAGCHHPHARSRSTEQLPCLGCHAGAPRAGLHRSPGHEHCLDCHRPHLWRSGDASCTACHQATHAAGRACAPCHGFGGAGAPRAPAEQGGAKAAGGAP